jgi:beta propeller repeat protein
VASGSGHQLTPDISGTIVVWEDARGTNPEVWYLDLADGTERQVVMGTAQAPQISGRRAVWQQQAPGSWDIVMKDL